MQGRLASPASPLIVFRSRGLKTRHALRPTERFLKRGQLIRDGDVFAFQMRADAGELLVPAGNPDNLAAPPADVAFFFYPHEQFKVSTVLRKSALPDGCALIFAYYSLDGRLIDKTEIDLKQGKHELTVEAPPAPGRASMAIRLSGTGRLGSLKLSVEPTIASASHFQPDRADLPFDAMWYGAQLDPAEIAAESDLLEHYRQIGEARGLTPHPWFDPGWYRRHYMVRAGRKGSAIEDYAERARREKVRPHPLFDADWYRRHYLLGAGTSALEDFLDHAQGEPRSPNAAHACASIIGGAPGGPEAPGAKLALSPVRRVKFMRRDIGSVIDESFSASDPTILRTRRSERVPLVSIVLNATAKEDLSAALDSLVRQTLGMWELLVPDRADFRRIVERELPADRRVRFIRIAGDDARTMNRCLAAARGALIAFMEPGAAWTERYLAVQSEFLQTSGRAAVCCYYEFREDGGRTRYAGRPLQPDQRRYQNTIPLATVMICRAQTGRLRFDPAAGTAFHWDYLLRLEAIGSIAWTPVLSARLTAVPAPAPSPWDRRLINCRGLDWKRAVATDPAIKASIVIAANGLIDEVGAALNFILSAGTESPYEILVVDAGVRERDLALLMEWPRLFKQIRVLRTPIPFHPTLAMNYGVLHARSAIAVLMHPGVRVRPGWLEALTAPFADSRTGIVQPPILWADGQIRSAATVDPDLRVRPPSGGCIAVRSEDFIALKGFDPLFGEELAEVDLSLRMRRERSKVTEIHGGDGLLRVGERSRSWIPASSDDLFVERWNTGPAPAVRRSRFAATFAHIAGAAANNAQLRFAIKVCDTEGPIENSGDWHFSRSLKRAIEALGHACRIDATPDWYDSTAIDDVVIVLRGRFAYRPSPRHLNLMWVISHPDDVTGAEAASFDHVFVAADGLIEVLGARMGRSSTTLSTLLQCTDPSVFFPDPSLPAKPEGIVFVANSRGVHRPLAAAAIAERLPVSLHGRGWEKFAAFGLVRSQGLPNNELADHYRRNIVLNDHWEDMRQAGILSNRLFDAAACATPIISDEIKGLYSVFRNLIDGYTGDALLSELVADAYHCAESLREKRLALASHILENHSFSARAQEIVDHAVRRASEVRMEMVDSSPTPAQSGRFQTPAGSSG